MKRSYLLAGVIALVAVIWIGSGQFGGSDSGKRGTAAPATQERPLTAVRTTRFNARGYTQFVVVRGQTQAKRTVRVSAEVRGRIVKLPVEKGARVKRGAIVAEIAVDDRRARLTEAKALVRQREIEYEAAKALKKKGFRAETQFASNAALLEAAKATATRMEIEIGKTRITAPFDGIIDARHLEAGDYADIGDAVLTLVDEDPFLVVADLAENDVERLRPGSPARARLVTGREIEGRVSFIATTANPQTRTFRVDVEVANPAHDLRDGITADVYLPVGTVDAHFVSPALLVLNDRGLVGVRAVTDTNTVAFLPVEILGDAADGVWLGGLPQTIDIISVGQEFVRDGERVRATRSDGTVS